MRYRETDIKLPEYRWCNRHGEPKPCYYCRVSRGYRVVKKDAGYE